MKIILMFLLLLLCSCGGEDNTPILKKRTDGGVTLNIPLTGSLQNAAFSPDGASIVFTRFINGLKFNPTLPISIMCLLLVIIQFD